jgi:hypothetical protein
MKLYDYVESGSNMIRVWTLGLQPEERARLKAKLKTLEKVTDPLQLPKFIFPVDTKYPEIRKAKAGVMGSKTALRPMLCRGPANKNTEITLLIGAKESGGKLPKGIAAEAERRRQAIIADQKRRVPHEWA